MDINKLTGFVDIIKESGSRDSINSLGGSDKEGSDFSSLVGKSISQVNSDLVSSEKMSREFLVEGKHDLHEVMISMEKADMSFRYLTQVRNKVLDAYAEVMRMQV